MTTFIARFIGGPADGEIRQVENDDFCVKAVGFDLTRPTSEDPDQFIRLVHHAYELDNFRIVGREYVCIFYIYLGVLSDRSS